MRPRSIARRLTSSFALLAAVAVAVAVVLLFLLLRLGATLSEVRDLGGSVRDALGLALSVREHYLHGANVAIRGTHGEMHRHASWLDGLQERVEALSTALPEEERAPPWPSSVSRASPSTRSSGSG